MSTITFPSQSLPDFSELVKKLQSTAQALLAFSSSAFMGPDNEPPAAEEKKLLQSYARSASPDL